MAGGGCGHLHRKNQEKVKKIHATFGDDVTSLMLVFAQVHYKSFWRIIFII